MKYIQPESLPPPNGHYSHAVAHNGLLYISGQLPVDPEHKKPPSTIEAQTELILRKLDAILTAGKSNRQQVLQVRIYISDIGLWDKVNALYATFFQQHKPARVVVPTSELHFGCLIELEATAAIVSSNRDAMDA